MMRGLILVILILISGMSFGQGTVIELRPNVRNDDNGKSLSGATIEVYKNGSLFVSEKSASSGKVPPIELPVCMGCTYTIKIKKPGYVTKIAIMDGHSDYPEELPPGTVVQKFEVGIFESVEGIDFSFLEKEPMVEFAIDSYGIIGFDQQKIKVMKKKIEDLRKKIEKKKEELAKEEVEKKKREADFSAYVEAGDAAIKKKEYEKAIGQYELALGIKPDDQPVKDKIQDAKIKLEELRANAQTEKDFNEKMKQGKTAYSGNDLEKALTLYKEASGIKPEEQLPKDLIAEIEKKLAEQKNNEAAFNKLVADGDAASGSEDFEEAINKYQEALKLKKDSAVETKLADAKNKKAAQEDALAADKANQDKYNQLIASADAAFDTEKYDEARKKYEEAGKLKPDAAHPVSQIKTIAEILAKRADEQAAKDKLEADYKKSMAEGKEKFDQRSWDDSKAKYEAALALKPNDNDALNQIDLINKEIEKDAADSKLSAEYNAHMAEAKTLFDQKKYAEAKSKYNLASGVKPQEQEPKNKIAEIERIVADADKAAELEAQYTGYMTTGDGANDRKDYATALDSYKKALGVKPGDSVAQSKIDAINKLIDQENQLKDEQAKFDGFVASAKESFNAKDYDKAKLNYKNALGIKDDADIRAKIKEIDEIIAQNQSAAETQAKYDAAIKDADELYRTNAYPEALEKYNAALSIKDEDYPKQKISELKEKIAASDAAAAKEKQFNDLVADGNAAFDAKDYGKALAKFKEAIQVKPDAALSKKVAEIDLLITAESQNADKRTQYDKKIAEGDAAFTDENWNGARGLFEEAKRILPSESYPDDRITEIEKRMAEDSAKETERNYQKIITKADALFNDDKLDEAKSYYDRAIGIKPSDIYTKEQLDKIDAIKKERSDALTNEKRLNEQYDALIKEGERDMDASNWSAALDKFNEALTIKPTESYPKNKISEIESKMDAADLEKQKDTEYLAALAKADGSFNSQDYVEAIKVYNEALAIKPNEQYPKDKITSAENFMKLETENEEEAAYQKMLAAAQKNFDEKDYEKSLDLYLRAKNTKPSDPLPQQRIDEINQILSKNSENEILETKYTDFIKEADYQYEKGNWKKARESYQGAYSLFKREYPEKRIKECEDAMQVASNAEVNKNYDKIIDKADEYLGKLNYEKAKGLYERALGIKPTDQYPKDKLEEIQQILNPQTFAKSKTNLNNYGDPNRSVDAVDVENMLADAEEQRKFIRSEKAQQQKLDAMAAEELKVIDQTDYIFDTREKAIGLRIDIEDAEKVADNARDEAVIKTEEMELVLYDLEADRIKGNENSVQLQNQVVNNIKLELHDKDIESDLPREAYLADVEMIRLEIANKNKIENSAQTNATFDQENYINKYQETRIEGDPNMDIARKNTETHTEDFQIQLINKGNHDIWNQEDVIMEIKNETEILRDVQIASDANSDIPREEGIYKIEESNLNLASIGSAREDRQYDVSIDQKKYTENILTTIELENLGNDIPREKMESFTEKQKIENQDALEELTIEQNNELFGTNSVLEGLEIAIVEKAAEDDLNREGYEKVVERITEGKDDFIEGKTNDSEDESFTTQQYIADGTIDRSNANQSADQNADDNIDDTKDAVEDMMDEKDDLADKSRVDLENSEDFVESLRDLNLNEIDESVKNALGDQFPEGMTEEIYTINDENGLMVSYIVRRIVVRNEEGNVYEKVQTKFGTVSYSCNGSGITEYQWQDETQAVDLVRN